MNSFLLKRNSKSYLLGTAITAMAATAGLTFMGMTQWGWQAPTASPAVATKPTQLPGVSALGRLEPIGEIIQVAAPLTLDGDRLAALKVNLGDHVEAGDPIAVLDSRDRLQDEVIQAQVQVQQAQAQLAQVNAGAKEGAIAAQQATVNRQAADLTGQLRRQRAEISRIEAQLEGDRAAQTAAVKRLQAELTTAEAELVRYQALYEGGAVSASRYDSQKLGADTAREALEEAKAVLGRTESTAQRQLREAREELARLESTGQAQVEAARSTLAEVAEVRAVDVQMAQVELSAAQAALVRAQNNLAKATIRAPKTGRILEIYTRPGEQMSSEGIVALGETDKMLAIAEVYQSDISRVRLGQTAQVRGQAFTGELEGEVIEIGKQISRQSVFSGEPGENLDRRIVTVKIAIAPKDSLRVADLSNLQVQTVIEVSS